jgi:hypothetical protein
MKVRSEVKGSYNRLLLGVELDGELANDRRHGYEIEERREK